MEDVEEDDDKQFAMFREILLRTEASCRHSGKSVGSIRGGIIRSIRASMSLPRGVQDDDVEEEDHPSTDMTVEEIAQEVLNVLEVVSKAPSIKLGSHKLGTHAIEHGAHSVKVTNVGVVKSNKIPSDPQKTIVPVEEEDANSRFNHGYWPGAFSLWAYGVAAVIGGQYYGWNEALGAGFGNYIIAQLLMGAAYCVMMCCLAEIVSSTTFSGGTYGMARVVLGFYPGFLMACLELFEYLFYTAMSAMFIAQFITDEFNISENFMPLLLLAFYASALVFTLAGGKTFWRFCVALGIFTLAIMLIYCFGSMGSVSIQNASLNRSRYSGGSMHNWFAGGMAGFLSTLPATTWGFGGIESTALMTDIIDHPTKNYPIGAIGAVLTLFFTVILVNFVACTASPGLSAGQSFIDFPYFMDYGFESFGINRISAEWLIIPAQYSMAFGFILPYAKLMQAMADSNLLPKICMVHAHKPGMKQSLTPAILVGCFLSYVLCIINYYFSSVDLTIIPILLGFITYLSNLYAYAKLKTDFSTVHREFECPFGLYGAVYAATIFLLGIISIAGFIDDDYTVIYVLGLVFLLSVYYFMFAISTQTFSESEQKSLLVLYVMVMNKKMRQNMKKKKKKGSAGGSSNATTSRTNESLSTAIAFSQRLFHHIIPSSPTHSSPVSPSGVAVMNKNSPTNKKSSIVPSETLPIPVTAITTLTTPAHNTNSMDPKDMQSKDNEVQLAEEVS